MPVYEYGCDACGYQFEEQQRLADAPLKTCPKCHKKKLQKLISATAFVLKGGGWYKDGYGSSKDKPADKSNDSTTATAPATTTDKKADAPAATTAKAETKSETKVE